METFTTSEAKQLIKAALDSNSMKLAGPSGTVAFSKEAAERDAAYLVTLLNSLTKPPAQ